MRWLVFVAVLAGCGRIYFDPIGDGDGGVTGDLGAVFDTTVLPPCTVGSAGIPDEEVLGGLWLSNNPSLAWLGGTAGYAVGFGDNRTGALEGWFARLSDQGQLSGVRQITTTTAVVPSVAWSGTRIGYATRPSIVSGDVNLRRLDTNGNLLDPVLTISTNEGSFGTPEAAARDHEIGVVWNEQPGSRPSLAVYRDDGTVVVPAFPVTTTSSSSAVHVAGYGNVWLVAFGGMLQRPMNDLVFVIVDASGAVLTPLTSATGATGATAGAVTRYRVVATPQGFVLAWIDTRTGAQELWVTMRGHDGSPMVPPTSITVPVSELALSWGPRGTALAWYDTDFAGMRASWLDGAATAPLDISTAVTQSNQVAIAVGATDAMIIWGDNRVSSFDLRRATLGCP